VDAGVVEGEVDAGYALGVGPGAVGGAVGGGAGFAFAEGRGEDGFDLGGGEEGARCGELGVQGLGEGEGREGEDGWDEGEEPGRAWGHGWALWGVRCGMSALDQLTLYALLNNSTVGIGCVLDQRTLTWPGWPPTVLRRTLLANLSTTASRFGSREVPEDVQNSASVKAFILSKSEGLGNGVLPDEYGVTTATGFSTSNRSHTA